MDYSSTFNRRIGSVTNIIGRPPLLYRSSELVSNGCQFASVYAVREEDARYIEEAGTAAGFKGAVWASRLWVDFDAEEPAERAKAFLKEQGYDHVVYTTGGRGCHIGIARDSAPSHVLPLQDKLWASENLPGCDLSLYWHLHLIRLPGAVHERTGLSKRLLYRVPGRVLVLPPYEPTSPVRSSGGELGGGAGRERAVSLFQEWEVMNKLGVRETNGGRHKHLVALARTLRDIPGTTAEETKWMLMEVNRGFSEPKAEEEINSIVGWAYGR